MFISSATFGTREVTARTRRRRQHLDEVIDGLPVNRHGSKRERRGSGPRAEPEASGPGVTWTGRSWAVRRSSGEIRRPLFECLILAGAEIASAEVMH
jgi:hypothetical protein